MKISLPLIILILFGFYLQGCKSDEDPEPCNGTLFVEVSSVSNSPCGEAEGTITVNAAGGTGAFQFQLDGGTFQSDAVFSDVAQGEHTITVKDVNDCVSDVKATVKTGVVFSDISTLIKSNCAVTGCHDGSADQPNFNEDGLVKANAANIKIRTGNKSMPPSNSGITLTDEQIALLACWVDDGAPD